MLALSMDFKFSAQNITLTYVAVFFCLNGNNISRKAGIEMDKIIEDYRELHKIAEVGFELLKTTAYVKQRLDEIGIKYKEIGKCGIMATVGKGEKCIMLRADMDALPIKEETELEYACKSGNMHACGHDAHTAMLLGAARALKSCENELDCTVKLLFQPAEETLEGAKNMIESGILENPSVNAAAMLHVVVGTELECGSVIVSSEGVSAPAVDYFRITLKGKGAHGSTPEKSRDPLTLACRILLALDEIKSRELGLNEKAVITVGHLAAGNAANVIPDVALIEGSVRAFRADTREYIKNRIEAISGCYSEAFECKCEVEFYSGAPALVNDGKMSALAQKCANEALGEDKTYTSAKIATEAERNGQKSVGAGSEDFAYIAEKVPSVMIALAAGKASDGYVYPLHHPKFRLDENALPYGAELLFHIVFSYYKQM